MFCPKCHAAFPDGPLQCSSCGVDLVAGPENGNVTTQELVDLLTTPDVALLAVVKSVLDSAGIPYVVQGEEGLRTFPLGMTGGFFNPSAFAAVIRVRRRDYPDAQCLLAETADPDSGDQ
jgi:hypothetical protein